MARLIIGPLLRHVGERTATVWVETDRPGTVGVLGASSTHTAPTFTVHGHHYALVEVGGLEPGSSTPYEVALDGRRVWPEPGSPFPPGRIRTLPAGATRLRLALGSCRHPGSVRTHGQDALSAYARRLRGATEDAWPSALLLVGDQVYADRPPEEVVAFARGRRDLDQPPHQEAADFEEYAMLYRHAWTGDEQVRWLLSTVPTLMIFDDHDIRDDWNTSYAWREAMRATPWWRRRIVGGLGAYWVYQHLGNLTPDARAADPVYAAVREGAGDGGAVLDAFAERTDRDPSTTRWSYACELGRTRVVAVDSRCGRVLESGRRAMLDEREQSWVDGQIRGDADHLLIISSLPYLLPVAVHYGEAWNEALCRGVWGRWLVRASERLRQRFDLEHWAAFRGSFAELARGVLAAARGERGDPPATITFLSGDVHFSYLARVVRPAVDTAINQVVCSPLRNPLNRPIRWVNAIAALAPLGPPARAVARLSGVPAPPLRWRLDGGLCFQNAIATLEIDGRAAIVRWEAPSVPARGTPAGSAAGPAGPAGAQAGGPADGPGSAGLTEVARARLSRAGATPP